MTGPDKLTFTKLEALGNDFALVDARQHHFTIDSEAISRLADRQLGIGFDQLLVLDAAEHDDILARVRIYNRDGSQAEQCGNGMRAVALWLHRRGEMDKHGRVATAGGKVELEYRNPDHISASLAIPDFRPEALGLLGVARFPHRIELDSGPVQAWGVSVGNPHLLIERDEPPTFNELESLGQPLSTHPSLPEGANIGLAHIDNQGRIVLRVFERGSGPTRACGSGACAAGAVMIQRGRVDSPVEVIQPGGRLVIDWQASGQPVTMTGPAREVFEGTCPWPT